MTLEELYQQQPTTGRRKPKHEEDKLQIACKAWFDNAFCDVYLAMKLRVPWEDVKNIKKLMHHSPNEGELPGGEREGAKRKAMGVRAGFPDFILLMAGRGYSYMAIELKTEKGRQSESQKEFQKAVEWSGGKYVIVRSLEEFKKLIFDYFE